MEPYRVFISSIMNRATEDLIAERESARAAVDHFAPVTIPWAFEAEPASPKPLLDFYIDGVKSSDLFVILIGSRMTLPVKAEFDTAATTASRCSCLRRPCRRSLGGRLLTLIRGDGEQSFGPGDRAAQLRAYARSHAAVRVVPLLPDYPHNSFQVRSVDAGVVTLEKDSNRQSLTVPLQRIEDVLAGGPDEQPTPLLNGRLQWITVPQVWRFFPEKPLPGDPTGLGFAKERARNNPGVPAKVAPFAGWSLPQNIPGHLADGRAVFYDEDGKYITSAGQILLVRLGG